MSNPFDNEGNPFADAAVIEAADNEDNDYEETQIKKKGDKERLFTGTSSSSAPPPQVVLPPPPSYGQPDDSTRRKEEELQRKERELEERQRQIEQQQLGGKKAPNWPPFKPFIYHSIPDEIPPEWQKTVRNLYYSWLLTIVVLFWNMIGALCVLIAGVTPIDFGVSIMYFFVISICSFFLWYRPVYNAFMKDTSFYFLMYLVFGGFHLLFEAYMLIGIPESGSGGLVNMIFLFSKDPPAVGEGVICVICTVFWVMLFLFSGYLYRIVYMVYRARGHSVADARNQAISSAVQSDAGRQAVTSAVQGVAQSYVQGGGNNQHGYA